MQVDYWLWTDITASSEVDVLAGIEADPIVVYREGYEMP